jgi:hypothetical protein
MLAAAPLRWALSAQAKGGTWTTALETQLCYEVKTFLLAGHETSAAMLTWSLYELTQRPDALSKVRFTVINSVPGDAAAALAHFFYLLCAGRRCRRLSFHVQVREEAAAAFGESDQEPSRAAAEAMTYTLSCLKVRAGICSLLPLKVVPGARMDDAKNRYVGQGGGCACNRSRCASIRWCQW